MQTLYIRTSERPTTNPDGTRVPWQKQKTVRRWVRVGLYCPACFNVVLDPVPDPAVAA